MRTKDYLDVLESLQVSLLGMKKTAHLQFENGIGLDKISQDLFVRIHLEDALETSLESNGLVSDPISLEIYTQIKARYKVLKTFLYNLKEKGEHNLSDITLDL